MRNPLAKKTIRTIEHALEDNKSTAITEVIKIIQELAGRAFSISIPELSTLIGRDPAITEKVISAANTLGFNPSGAPILTISNAIHTIGFETVRNLAISLMLAQTAGQRRNSYEQREMAAMCVCSGLLAQVISEEKQTEAEPDLVFVCAALRNYGKLLMASFMVDEFREMKSIAFNTTEDAAYVEVFGMTPLELGRYLLRSSNMPKIIMGSLREVDALVLQSRCHSPDEEILVLSQLCGEVCAIIFDENIGPEKFNEALTDALGRFNRSMAVPLESVNSALLGLEATMNQLNRALGLKDGANSAVAKLAARVSGETLPPPPKESRVQPRPVPKPFEEMNAQEREDHAERAFQKATQALDGQLVPGGKINVAKAYQDCAQAIAEGLNLDNCLVFVREELDPDKLSARHGLGPLFEKIKNRPLIAPSKGDVFSICLSRKEDILIQDITKGRIVSVMPDWITTYSDTSSFVILPTTQAGRLFAIIVGAVSKGRSLQLEEGDLRRLRLFRSKLAEMTKMIQEQSLRPA